jgi:hypothetical protein
VSDGFKSCGHFRILSFSHIFSLLIGFFILIVAFAYQLTRYKEIIKFVHLLSDFDKRSRVFAQKTQVNNLRTKILVTILLIFAALTLNCIGSTLIFYFGYQYKVEIFFPLGYGYILIYFTLFVLQFSFASLALKRRFRLLNDNLIFAFGATTMSVHTPLACANLPATIAELYSQLCVGIDLINAAFTLQLIPFVIIYLSVNLFSGYSLIRELVLKSSVTWETTGNTLWWLLLLTLILSIALHSAHAASLCARRTPRIVGGILRSERWARDERLVGVFKTLMLEAQQQNLHFQNEFFRIEWRLLFSVSFLKSLKDEKFMLIVSSRFSQPCCRSSL